MGSSGSTSSSPLVSCILPTKNRAGFIPQAIRSFQSQTYPNKELIVLDNGNDQTESWLPPDPYIHYARVVGNKTVGEMRNLCAGMAQGEIICHFDSDDWSAPERVTDQVTRLGAFGVVTGYHEMFFYDGRDDRSYLWRVPHAPRMVLGTSLCYRKDWWEHHRFADKQVGEDILFFKQALRQAPMLVTMAPADKMMVARVHNHQTCRKSLRPTSYKPIPTAALPQEFPRGL